MPEGLGQKEMFALWQEGQQVFWSAAAERPAFEDASAFMPEGLQVFDSWAETLLDQAVGPDKAQALKASLAYRDVVLGAWMRIRETFETHRRAIYDPAAPMPDWRLLRDRWFQIAEAEFIQTMRSAQFLGAQRGVVQCAITHWNGEAEGLQQRRAILRQTEGLMSDLADAAAPIATTPKDIIWSAGRTSVARYRSLGSGTSPLGPVLICHGLIGRQSMIDLRPDRSLVRHLLAAGADVFEVDWGSAGPEDKHLGLDHFAGTQLPDAVQAVLATSGDTRLFLFGICQGGTLAAIHAATRPEGLAGLITAVAPFDFHADDKDADPAHGLLNLWVRSLSRQDLEGLIALEGNLPGELMGMIFSQLNPVRTLEKYLIRMVEAAPSPAAFQTFAAMERWLADRPDLPGALARTWLVDLYLENALTTGNLRLNGQKVDLSRTDVPVLNVVAASDHIVPPPCARALGSFLDPARYTELSMPTGHIGTFVSARAQTLLPQAIIGFLKKTRTAPFPPQ